MGVKVGVTKQELYPIGEYLLRITGNAVIPDSGKVRIMLVVVRSDQTGEQYKGRELTRNFNPKVSGMSDLGKLFVACGYDVNNLQAGQQIDLDVLTGRMVWGTNTHFNSNFGTINSLSSFRRAEGGTVPTPVQPPVSQQVQQPPVSQQVQQPPVNQPPVAAGQTVPTTQAPQGQTIPVTQAPQGQAGGTPPTINF